MSEADLLLALIGLALITLAAIVIGWLADRHLTRTTRPRKDDI